MKVLLTGGAGYLGSTLLPMLLEDGHQVRIVDKFMWGVNPVLSYFSNPNVEIMSGDVREAPVIEQALKGMDAVIHLAAIVGYPACSADEDLAISTNVKATELLVKSMKSQQKLIFASTGSTYGKVEGICDENTPINPLTVYGKSKFEGEKLMDQNGAVRLRLATVFGISPRMRLDLLVNDFCYKSIHDHLIVMFEGWHRRTFLHVKDAARAFVFALNHYDQMSGEAYNVGSDSMNYTKKEVAEHIMAKQKFYLHEAEVGKDLDQRDYAVSYEKIKALGYKTTVSLDEGIDELLKVCPLIKIENPWRNH